MRSSGADIDELEALYRRDLARFVRTAAAIVGDEDTAIDAVHDAFAGAVRGRRTFRREVPLEAWVWRIVVNAALQARRARRGENLDPAAGEELPSEPNGHPVEDVAVRRWVVLLPERQRLAVFLRYFADLDYRSRSGWGPSRPPSPPRTPRFGAKPRRWSNDRRRAADPSAFERIFPEPVVTTDWGDILRRAGVRTRHRRQARVAIAFAAIAAVVAASALTVPSVWQSGTHGAAYAATPPALDYARAADAPSARSLLLQLAGKAAAQPDPAAGRYDFVETRGWYFDATVGANGAVGGSLDPTERRQWIAPDGSGRIAETRAGRASDETYPAGGLSGPQALSGDPAALRAQLAQSHPDYGTFEWFVAVNDVWLAEVVPPAVQAALLEILADEPGLVDSGRVTDRAGRPGVAVSTVSDHSGLPTRYTLVFDPATGRLLDFEQTVLEAGKLPLKAPAVVGYTLWLRSGRTDTTHATP